MIDEKTKIYKIIAEQFAVDFSEIDDTQGPGDLPGWDSLGQLQLILKIEQSFKTALSLDDVMSINNISDIVKIITNDEDNELVNEVIKKTGEVAPTKKETTFSTNIPIRLPRNIYLGFGTLSILNEVISSGKIVVITSDSPHGFAFFEQVLLTLNTKNEVVHVKKSGEEPKEDEIVNIAELLKSHAPELIIAIGGGSIIDTGKLSWLLYENPEINLQNTVASIEHAQLRKLARFVAIPTTFGSGAEVSSAAAFTKKNEDKKTIIVSHDFIPDYVFLDATMGDTLPQNILFSSAFDALTHAIEGYVSLAENAFVKPLAVSAIRNIIIALKDIFENGARNRNLEQLCHSSFWAGVVQNHCSVGATHSFAHKLSGRGIGHGLANAAFLVPVINKNSSKSDVYHKLIKELGYNDLNMFTSELTSLICNSNIINKSEFVTLTNDQDSIVNGAMEDITFRTNPVALSVDDMKEILSQTIRLTNE